MNKEVTVFKEDLEKIESYIANKLNDQNDINEVVNTICEKLDVADEIVFEVVKDVQRRFLQKNYYDIKHKELSKELQDVEEMVLQFFEEKKEEELNLLTLVLEMKMDYKKVKEMIKEDKQQ